MQKIWKIKEMRPNASSHLNIGTVATSIPYTDAGKTLRHKLRKRPAENSSVSSQAEQGGAE